MKRFFLVIFLSAQLTAFDTVTASKIFDKIFTGMFPKKPIIVYTPNREYQDVIVYAPSLTLAGAYRDADILLADAYSDIPKGYKGVVFTTNAAVFAKNSQAVGAFYWEHGRPRIYFLQRRLEANNISLSRGMQRYIVKEIP